MKTVINTETGLPKFNTNIYDIELSYNEKLVTLIASANDKELLIKSLKEDFSNKISNIKGMSEAIERKLMDSEEFLEEIIEEKRLLIEEYRQLKSNILND